jgi:hypothetical protein
LRPVYCISQTSFPGVLLNSVVPVGPSHSTTGSPPLWYMAIGQINRLSLFRIARNLTSRIITS